MWTPVRHWIISCLFILILKDCVWARQYATQESGEELKAQRPEGVLENNPTVIEPHDEDKARAVIEVQKAQAELRSLQDSSGSSYRFEKRSGFVGSTAYYVQKGVELLFMNGPERGDYSGAEKEKPKLSKPLSEAVRLLENAAKQRNTDALYLLAEMNFFGNFSHPRNYEEAFRRYEELASLTGNSSAQYMIGFMYATGIGNVVERDQAKALIYHTCAAKGGNIRSEMTLAFRYHSGIGASRNCNEAVVHYKSVADKAIEYARSGPPGGLPLTRQAYRLADEVGGVYGEGASYISSGYNAHKGGPNSDRGADFEDVMEYLDLMSRKGDLKITLRLGQINYDGSRTMRRNFRIARKYFMQVARQYWNKDDKVISDDTLGTGKVASKAAAYLGRLHLRGEGVPSSYEKALRWFRLGVKNGDAYCQYELGLMHLHGLGVRKDVVLAANYFKEAAQQDWPAAQIHLGKLFLDQGDLKTAMTYFELAARHGHIEALYHLAEISNYGVGRERSCGLASAYYKVVAEKTENLHSSFIEANEASENGDKETALVNYMMAAEQGYEQAQANVAYILDEHTSIVSFDGLLPWKLQPSTLLRNAALALIYWTRSAKQSNIDSTVKAGDYYLKGYGVEGDVEKAAVCYQSAADMQQSGQALWNLGWMHENGIGVEQDFHLAKRFYDQSLDTNAEAYLPVKLSLLKLRLRSYWNTITNGNINSIQPEPEESRQYRTWNEWLANFLEDENHYYGPNDGEDYDQPAHDHMQDGDDYYYDDVDASILETLTIVALAGALVFLVYYRQLRQQNQRRIARAQDRQQDALHPAQPVPAVPEIPGQQADGGFFPPPDDPNFDAWRAGGIGH